MKNFSIFPVAFIFLFGLYVITLKQRKRKSGKVPAPTLFAKKNLIMVLKCSKIMGTTD